MPNYFRLNENGEDPELLLEPENQVSKPWGGPDHGPCDKCGGTGKAAYHCESCIAAGRDPDCEACEGRVEFDAECPTCEGAGWINDSRRAGVSVFPRPEGLVRYMLKRGTDLDACKLVELEGERTGDVDFDADEGALLVKPLQILGVSELDAELVERLRRDVDTPS